MTIKKFKSKTTIINVCEQCLDNPRHICNNNNCFFFDEKKSIRNIIGYEGKELLIAYIKKNFHCEK